MDEREELRLQARLLVRPALASVVDLVVSRLDERGLLPGAPPFPAPAGPTCSDWAEAVRAVQTAGPPGVAAPDVHACLLAQAKWHAARGGPVLLVPLVARHLPEVARGDHEGIAARLSAPPADGRRRGLPPHPAAAVGARDRAEHARAWSRPPTSSCSAAATAWT